jgi:curli biogenesis system outer membrane secretion channel CsgG
LVTGFVATLALAGLSGTTQAQAKRPSVAVMDFDFGTVCSGYSGCWWGNVDIGKGMADQVVDALVNDGSFRVIERKKLDTILAEQDFAQSDRADPSASKLAKVGKVLGIKYIISGSITKFGGEDKSYGGAGIIKGPIGALGFKKSKSYVTLTARMIDATTGEILASTKGEGISKKGGGITVGGGAGGIFAGGGMSSSNYRESALGEAQEMACNLLVAALVAKKDRLE